jgi:hypothetical protein
VFVTSADRMPAVAGEHLRTGMNEPKTEPRALAGGAADRPTQLLTVPNGCRVNPWTLNLPQQALVGTDQDLIGGHEVRFFLIADSERIAHCGPSLIAPAEYAFVNNLYEFVRQRRISP